MLVPLNILLWGRVRESNMPSEFEGKQEALKLSIVVHEAKTYFPPINLEKSGHESYSHRL